VQDADLHVICRRIKSLLGPAGHEFVQPTFGLVSVLLGNGDGTFQKPQTFDTAIRPYAVAVADVNGDGKPDLIVTNALNNSVSVLLGNGDGTFTPVSAITAVSRRNTPFLADLTVNEAKPREERGGGGRGGYGGGRSGGGRRDRY
jgi:hypothetical protein